MAEINLDPAVENKPIRDIAYETLKHAIVIGEIPAGSRIVETEYAERMHISRTPLREALRKLEIDGLVEYLPRRGVMVRTFTVDDVEEIYTIRNTLEMLTLPAVVANITDEDVAELRQILSEMDPLDKKNDIQAISPRAREFHARFTSISGQKRIVHINQTQDEYLRRFSEISIAKDKRRHAAHQEHHDMVIFAEQHDLENLKRLVHKHIERSKETCLQALEEAKHRHDQ